MIQDSRIFSLLIASILAISTLSGCGFSGEGPPEPVFPVTGVVTYQGKPVVGADITFMNQEKKRSGFGRTDEEGRYELTTFAQNDGAVEGKSIVTVTKFVDVADTAAQPKTESPDYQPPGIGEDLGGSNISDSIPVQYASAKSSGLFANIMTSGKNKFDFELK
ncbi:MAG: carboxypeptidase-like regulatory domain-containing protein [Fuerstiella sp.]